MGVCKVVHHCRNGVRVVVAACELLKMLADCGPVSFVWLSDF